MQARRASSHAFTQAQTNTLIARCVPFLAPKAEAKPKVEPKKKGSTTKKVVEEVLVQPEENGHKVFDLSLLIQMYPIAVFHRVPLPFYVRSFEKAKKNTLTQKLWGGGERDQPP